jgi:hypothetical protein
VCEAVMDYAACNVVYVDRTAREDKLVKRDDATSTASLIDTSNHVQNHASGSRDPDAVDSNLQTLLGTFSEGSCRINIPQHDCWLTSHSACLYLWQIVYIETVRIKSSLNCRINTYPRPHRHTIRRSASRSALEGSSHTLAKLEITS